MVRAHHHDAGRPVRRPDTSGDRNLRNLTHQLLADFMTRQLRRGVGSHDQTSRDRGSPRPFAPTRFDQVVVAEFADHRCAPRALRSPPRTSTDLPESGAPIRGAVRGRGAASTAEHACRVGRGDVPQAGTGTDARPIGPVQLLRPAQPPVPDGSPDVRTARAGASCVPGGVCDIHRPSSLRRDHGRPAGPGDQRCRDGDSSQRHVPHGPRGAARPTAGVDRRRQAHRERDLHKWSAPRHRNAEFRRRRRPGRVLVG